MKGLLQWPELKSWANRPFLIVEALHYEKINISDKETNILGLPNWIWSGLRFILYKTCQKIFDHKWTGPQFEVFSRRLDFHLKYWPISRVLFEGKTYNLTESPGQLLVERIFRKWSALIHRSLRSDTIAVKDIDAYQNQVINLK